MRSAESPKGGAAVAIVFRQQPRALLYPDRPVTYIQTFQDRMSLLGDVGLDMVIPVDFDTELRSLTPGEFVTQLCRHLRMRHLVLGTGTAIGRDRRGDAATLGVLGDQMGFALHSIEPAKHADEIVSSSAIRTALFEGRMADVQAMLGRRFVLRGTVEPGERRGRELGYPTANLSVEPQAAVPRDGIYATWATVDVDRHGPTRVPAATSIGIRPTFGGRHRTVEAHLIGFEGDLYGRRMTVEFVARLRDELNFADAAALAAQIARDVVQTKAALGVS